MSEPSKAKLKTLSKKTPREASPPVEPEDTITFKTSHFYAALVALAFLAGVLVGFVIWGRTPNSSQATVANQSATQAPVVQAPVQTAVPQYIRYDVPAEGFPSLGPKDAPIVIVEFSDFQCPFCKRFHDETFQQLLAAYPGKIRFVYRQFPLTSIHPNASPAAEAAMCADEQNVFWKYHDKLFDNQQVLGEQTYIQIASDLGLDMTAFQDCLTNHRYQQDIQADSDFAVSKGVNATPTFFINGLAVVGAQPLDVFKQVIDKELAGEFPK